MMQGSIVGLLLVLCVVYAAWTLMPAALRRPLATALLRLPMPGFLQPALNRAAKTSGGCACDGCDAVKPAASTVQTIKIHRK